MAKVRVKTMQESYKNKGILALFATFADQFCSA
jgi:hypothetical protein